MVAVLTEDHASLVESLRALFAARASESEVRRLMETDEGYNSELWRQLAQEQGLQGMIVPEEHGGSGYTWVELGVVLEEMGRALFCGPFFATAVLAVNALLESGDERAQAEYLPRIASGEAIGTLAFMEESKRWDGAGISLAAVKTGDGFSLTGEKLFVLDGHIANFFIVAAKNGDGVSLFVVDRDTEHVTSQLLETLDQTRKFATVRFDNAPAKLLGAEDAGGEILARVLDLAAIGLAAEQVGAAQASLDMAVEYAKLRVQFGQPIGAFQAIKHMLADVMLEVESAKSAMLMGLATAAGQSEVNLSTIAPLAKAYCSDAFELASHQNIQVHGGMGFTWEVGAHLYFKRAKSTALFLGTADYHRERLATALGV